LRLFSNSMYDLMYNKYTKINKLKSINNHALQIHAEKKGGGRTTTKNTEMRKNTTAYLHWNILTSIPAETEK